MATQVRTLDFLPEIFRTESNQQFLGSTLDQIVSPPKLDKIEGYIGRKFEYGLTASDSYIPEINKARQNYQLEPAVIFTKKNTSIAVDALTYSGLVDAIYAENGTVDNHSKLFANEFYSWDSFVDLDKLVNFSQYYWLPDGPDTVEVGTSLLYNNLDFTVKSESLSYGITANDKFLGKNPTLKLLRGGTYTFQVAQDSKFYIQTSPGVTGLDPVRNNVNSREVYGVESNGTSTGIITFKVPYVHDQDKFLFPGENTVDIVSTIPFNEIHGKPLSKFAGIDRVNILENKIIMFYGFSPDTIAKIFNYYDEGSLDNVDYDSVTPTVINNNFYKITYVSGEDGDPVVTLSEYKKIPTNQRITVLNGKQFIGKTLYRNQDGEIDFVPQITANLDTLYYQDANNPALVGTIKLIENNNTNAINIPTDILGKANYTSPLGVVFTNGLKINFTGQVTPESYKNKRFYVEGVGNSIELIPETDLVISESFGQNLYKFYDSDSFDVSGYSERLNVPVLKDYITVHRSAINKNAWSRSNRWFHIDVLKTTIQHSIGTLSLQALNNYTNRANRPIIEFYPNLKLYNFGTKHKGFVDFIDTTATNAFLQVAGQTVYYPDGQFPLFDGATIVFTKDTDIDVRNKIYTVRFQQVTANGNPVITLNKSNDDLVQKNEQVVSTKGNSNLGKTYYFNGSVWVNAQQKTLINQPPLFDVFDSNGVSFSNQRFYNGSNFAGSKLFSYAIGSGNNDSVLNFPIKYSSVSNIGDISFAVDFNTDTFNFIKNSISTVYKITDGFVHNYSSLTKYNRKIGWEVAKGESFQYQAFDINYLIGASSPKLTFNIVPVKQNNSAWPTVKVFIDSTEQAPDQYTIDIVTAKQQTIITLLNPPTKNTLLQVLIYSDSKLDPNAYYTIPSNLSNNPFNVDIEELSLGDIKGHYQSIYTNSRKLTGDVFGSNNFRDKGNLISYGTKIVRNSASLVNAAVFLRNKDYSLIDSLTFSEYEYVKFKQLILNTVDMSEYTPYMTPSSMLDDALQQIASYKQESDSFFWSDMLPSRAPYISKTYTFNTFIDTSFFTLSKVYDFNNANYNSVLVYLNQTVDGLVQSTQLIRGRDYVVSKIEPKLEITKDLFPGQTITINEYNNTYGSYVPNTPSKLGLYSAYEPSIVLDNSYLIPTYFIKGHDGSLTKLYGEYNNGYLKDFKDKVLLEYETRIYNNIKSSAKIPIKEEDIMPGYFRNTGNSLEDIKEIYSSNFLDWVGKNNIDYASQFYSSSEKFTWNYTNTLDIFDKKITQGFWRGIYLWYYDTTTPHITPWEMLGIVNKPLWWDTRYGSMPYTSTNSLMWNDIEKGYNYNNGSPITLKNRARPGLSKMLPVDKFGNLRNPFVSVVHTYGDAKFESNWIVGDVGPAEYSYRRSSNYAFGLMKIFALMKPAKFFSLAQDIDLYSYNSEFKQYLLDGFLHDNRIKLLYGSGTAQHSYMNWVVDYVQHKGHSGYEKVSELLNNVDVRLVYRVAGFTDKEYLNFYLEKSSTRSTNASLLLPNESFRVMLYQNQPSTIIRFSSIIIQKTETGFTVSGNSQTRAYFTNYTGTFTGSYTTISINGVTVNIPNQYSKNITQTPYGAEFTTEQALSEFMVNYGRYLNDQGILFNNQENGFILNWNQMVAEVLYWISTGWEVGSLINVNPAANGIVIDKENLIVQPLTIHNQNYVLNQNLYTINVSDLAINRDGTRFEVRPLNDGDTIAYFSAHLSSLEHIIVFDNVSLFNDTIFNPQTGLRQNRLFLRGLKSAEWNGTLNASGFILNQDNIEPWSANVKYTKGVIVSYQNKYYMANKVISPSLKFNSNDWLETDYENIQKGLLPNANTRATESMMYYDTNTANLKNDGDLLGFSLIGYRPRDFLSASDLSDISQVNLFKSIIPEKGTPNIVNAVQNITLDIGPINYEVYENWALKTSQHGGIANHNFIEFVLNQQLLTGNPSIVSVIKNYEEPYSMQTVPLFTLTNFSNPITDTNILPKQEIIHLEYLPGAGYVSFKDIKMHSFTFENLNENVVTIDKLYQGDYIWVADELGTWSVITPIPSGTIDNVVRVVNVLNNLNGTCSIVFDNNHNLLKYDTFMIINYDPRINGFYRVNSIKDSMSVIVELPLTPSITNITNTGICAKFQKQRIDSPKYIKDLSLINDGVSTQKVWVDINSDASWSVMQKTINYKLVDTVAKRNSQSFGNSIAYDVVAGMFVGDPVTGTLYRYSPANALNDYSSYDLKESITVSQGYATAIAKAQDVLVVSLPNATSSKLYVYALHKSPNKAFILHQTITIANKVIGDTITLSGDKQWLFASSLPESKVYVYRLADDLTRSSAGFTITSDIAVHNKTFTATGDYADTFGQGDKVCFSTSKNETTYTIETSFYNSLTNKTTFYIIGEFKNSVSAGTTVYKATYTYTNVTTLNVSDVVPVWSSTKAYVANDLISYNGLTYIAVTSNTNKVPGITTFWKQSDTGFGSTISCNYDASKIFVGAPIQDFTNVFYNMGKVYVYNRLSQTELIIKNSSIFRDTVVTIAWVPNNGISVYNNGSLLSLTTDYTYNNRTFSFKTSTKLKAGDTLTFSSADFVYIQELTPYNYANSIRSGILFGNGLDTNRYGNEVLVGAPIDISVDNVEGAVYRYTHEGKSYGTITGITPVTLSTTTTVLINGTPVTLPGTGIDDVIDAIMSTFSGNLNNIGAKKLPNGCLQIYMAYALTGRSNDKLDITVFDRTILTALGLQLYTQTQVIREVHNTKDPCHFGYSIKFNEYNSFAVSATKSSRFAATTFDFIDDGNANNDTYFDNNFTRFVDFNRNTGAVYVYDYIPEYNEDLTNIGYYVYGQSCNDLATNSGSSTNYGKKLAFNDYNLIIGIPDFSTPGFNGGGRVTTFKNILHKNNWSIFRKPVDYVDLNKITSVQLYDNVTNERLAALDYIDPTQGKLLGAVTTNLDYIDNIDPAGYNTKIRNNNLVWSSDQVGKIWFNTSTTKFVSYHQEDVSYNSLYWGKVFPDSDVKVYSWVESDVTPVNYAGNGAPYDLEQYTTTVVVDNTGALVLKYYYWVRNTNIVFENKGKTLSDTVLESYIANPQASGIPFFVAFKPNVYGLYNCNEFINGTKTSLYIGYKTKNNDTPIYNEFGLIRANYEDDFLSGLPSIYAKETSPELMYEKLLDSFVGLDSQGRLVPDITLPKLMQTGISYRPRQSMFKDRLKALANYFGYANTVLKQYPIAEFKTPSLLGSSNSANSTIRVPTFFTITGTDFDTTKYWEYIYWWAEGYSDNTKIDVEVAKYYGLATITPYIGMIAGVTANSEGKREVYTYDGSNWIRVGLEQGTIQIKNSLWDYSKNNIGYDNNFYDTDSYDSFPSMETRYIIRALNEEVYTETLRVHRNKSLILLFEYIVGENTASGNNLTWLNKTSMVDVRHTLRELAQDKNYKRDNQSFLEGYIREVKPYHVIVKEFLLRYTKSETFTAQITDFDLPGRYNERTGKFITPNLVFDAVRNKGEFLNNNAIWTDTLYSDWYNNYGISLTGKPNYPITTLSIYINTVSDVLYVTDAYGLPVTGIIKIDNEYIAYATIDRAKGQLSDLSRGVNNSDVSEHIPSTIVYIDLPGVVLLESGRAYVDPPTVTAFIDTTKYPAPTRPALLEPLMENDKVIGINIVDPGQGYSTKPEIVIQPSISFTFDSSAINYIDRTIKIPVVSLVTGDAVKYTDGPNTAGISGLINKQYYYVRVLHTDSLFHKTSVIALYTTKLNALHDVHRIIMASIIPSTKNKLELCAKAVPIISNTPTRELITTLKFDRTSYRSKVEPWVSGEFYGSLVTASGAESSSSTTLDYAIPYPGLSGTGDTKGAKFTIYNILLNKTYAASVTFQGLLYNQGDVLTIKGEYLGGTTPTNNCTLTVTSVSGVGEILTVDVDGVPSTVTRSSLQAAVLPITNVSTLNTVAASATNGNITNDIFVAKGTLQNTFTKGMLLSGGTIPAGTVYIEEVVQSNFVADCPGKKVINLIAGTTPEVGMVVTGPNVPVDTTVQTVKGSKITLSNPVPYQVGKSFVGKFYKLNTTAATGQISVAITGTSGDTAITLNYSATNLSPGQIKGLQLYFYKLKSPYTYVDSRSGGATIKIYSPNFNLDNAVDTNYYLEIINPGTIYNDGEIIIVNGSLLGGITGINDAKIKMVYTVSGGIYLYELKGIAYNSYKEFYIKPYTTSVSTIYYDAAMLRPVPLYDFGYTSSDYAFLPEPIYITSGHTRSPYSLVNFNSTLYRCIVSNNDSEFDFDKWEEVRSDDAALNALDRIMGYYNPLPNMPGKNLPMLVSGIDYQNNTYFGKKFNDLDNEYDTILKDQVFYPSDIDFRSVTYNDDRTFIALGETDKYSSILISNDNGLNWTIKRISKNKLDVQDIVYNEGQYVVATRNKKASILTSVDLNTWVSVGDYTPFDTLKLDESAYDSTSVSAPNDSLNSITFNKTTYYSVGNDVQFSSDGYAWSTSYSFQSSLPQEFRRIAYVTVNNYTGYLAVGTGTVSVNLVGLETPTTTSRILSSVDGKTWDEIVPRITTSRLNAILFSNNLIVVAGDNGEIYTSINAQHWDPATITASISSNLLNGLYANGIYVIIGENGTILISFDGVTYEQMISNTNEKLTAVNYNNDYWVVVGENATILRSADTFVWENVSLIKHEENFYEIKGDPFVTGYGPEELVPGVLTDTLTMTVTTRPGNTWDVATFGHSGFTVKLFTNKLTSDPISFYNVTENPTLLTVFVMSAEGVGVKLYPNITLTETNSMSYTVDWINQTITLVALDELQLHDENYTLYIEVYEFGNGNQEIRSNTKNIPMRVDPITGNTEIWLNFEYEVIAFGTPVVYRNGVKLIYEEDYIIGTTPTKLAKLLFNTSYHPEVDYLSFAVMGLADAMSIEDVNYSIPETQIFAYSNVNTDNTLTLDNFVGLGDDGYTNIDNLILDYNGLRLIPTIDYTVDVDMSTYIGTVTLLTVTPGSDDVLSATTFNDTRYQYLLTEYTDTLRVNPILYISLEKGELTIYTTIEPEFETYDLVTLDGIKGTTQLNGNKYYARIMDTYVEDDITYYPIKLFYDPILAKPVSGKIVTKYISSGYIWKSDNTHTINQPDISLNDTSRIYVTINGYRVDSSRLIISTDNVLSILETINAGDKVLITSMIPNATPNQLVYVNTVDKNGEQLIYRANAGVKTWLTKDLESMGNEIHVDNVLKLVDIDTQEVTATTVNNTVVCYVNFAIETIKEISVYNITTLSDINVNDLTLAIRNSRPIIYIADGASDGDVLIVTLRLGDLINVDGEVIKYKKINYNTNTISGLTRGVNGSGVRKIHSNYTTVTGVKPTNTLFNYYYNRTWNSENYTADGDPLQLSDSFPANFLQVGIK